MVPGDASGFLLRFNRFGWWHDESVARPETGLLCVGIRRRVKITAVVARVEDVIGLAPVGRERADGVFDQIRRARPLGESDGRLEQLERSDQCVMRRAPSAA